MSTFAKATVDSSGKVPLPDEKSVAVLAFANLSDDKAVHLTLFKGSEKVVDAFFGKSGGRGQSARKAGVDGVFSVTGYSSSLYAREVKQWRDGEIVKFDDAAVYIGPDNGGGGGGGG